MTICCTSCRQPRAVSCTEEQYARWRNGALVQDAMPDVPAAERELLVSGICGECWRQIFRDEDENYDEPEPDEN